MNIPKEKKIDSEIRPHYISLENAMSHKLFTINLCQSRIEHIDSLVGPCVALEKVSIRDLNNKIQDLIHQHYSLKRKGMICSRKTPVLKVFIDYE